MMLLPMVLVLWAGTASAQEPSTAGFISIDCGLDEVSSYTGADNGIVYSWDKPYTSTGVNLKKNVYGNRTSRTYEATVRIFPDGVRNCYTIGPVKPGSKYRLEAKFVYGQYIASTFDLHLGVNMWHRITPFTDRVEIIILSDSDVMNVCLTNTDGGVPRISGLNLRPLSSAMYNLLTNSSYSLLIDSDRKNYGASDMFSFPVDVYDRGWYPVSQIKNISTNKQITLLDRNAFYVPQAILQTASEAMSISDSLNITIQSPLYYSTYVCMYFAELQEIGSNEKREFNIYANNKLVYGPFKPRYLQQDVYLAPVPRDEVIYSIQATTSSTLPPIINAIEVLRLFNMALLPTRASDVKAILEIKTQLQVLRYWEGDPCVPPKYIWSGLECNVDPAGYSRIVSLNLSRRGLRGKIPGAIANLSSLKLLDLSHNYFTGEIPSFIADLSALKFINLDGNNLSGTIPVVIFKKMLNGSLFVRVENNPYLCGDQEQCNRQETKKRKLVFLVSLVVPVTLLLLFLVNITLRRKRAPSPQTVEIKYRRHGAEFDLRFERYQFSKIDITNITNNFVRPIGRGSSGTVYLGMLPDGTQVAVKVLVQTGHGDRQFRAEAELLTRLHHRYLLSLLGYCKEITTLVYEFVPLGSLADQLSGESAYRNSLDWSVRLKIALQAAEGLEYLHNGCRPPIIHRDVKTSNILLTENFEAKLADFGLSKSFSYDGSTYLSTVLAGTPGYLDPEYQQTNMLSEKSDVYSFGIVLLELVTGKPPIIQGLALTHITKEVKKMMERGNIDRIVDNRITHNYEIHSIRRVIEIALSCASLKSNERPTMSDVVAELRVCDAIESSRNFKSSS